MLVFDVILYLSRHRLLLYVCDSCLLNHAVTST